MRGVVSLFVQSWPASVVVYTYGSAITDHRSESMTATAWTESCVGNVAVGRHELVPLVGVKKVSVPPVSWVFGVCTANTLRCGPRISGPTGGEVVSPVHACGASWSPRRW